MPLELCLKWHNQAETPSREIRNNTKKGDKVKLKLIASLLITVVVTVVAFFSLAATSSKAAKPKPAPGCFVRAVDKTPILTGCNTITKTQPVEITYTDDVSTLHVGPGTGACGQDTDIGACPACTMYHIGTKECWPKFLVGCEWEEQDSNGIWTAGYDQSVVNQTANQATEVCCGTAKPKTTCVDGSTNTYSTSHTCH